MKSTKEASTFYEKLSVFTFCVIQTIIVIITLIRLVLLKEVNAFTNTLEILSIVLVAASMNNLFIIIIFKLMSMINATYEAGPYYLMLKNKYKQFEDFKLDCCTKEELEQLGRLCKISKDKISMLIEHYINDKSYDEISEMFNLSYDGVNSALYQARKKLRNVLKEDII